MLYHAWETSGFAAQRPTAPSTMQVQLRYDLYEDRLLLIIEDADLSDSWWITRRGAIMLMLALAARASEILSREDAGTANAWLFESMQEQAAQSLSADTPPLAADNPTILVSVQHGWQDDGRHFLNFVGQDGREHALSLDDSSLFSVIELVKQQTALAEWNIDFTWPTADPAAEANRLNLQ